ncbi:MAG: hypothetical protein MZU97_21740 [Bacillus subtilis]|nr:hypothetical protein [Bacillus subtilis]
MIFYILITSVIGVFKTYSSVVAIIGTTGTIPTGSGGNINLKTIVFYIYDYIALAGQNSMMSFAAAALDYSLRHHPRVHGRPTSSWQTPCPLLEGGADNETNYQTNQSSRPHRLPHRFSLCHRRHLLAQPFLLHLGRTDRHHRNRQYQLRRVRRCHRFAPTQSID